MLNNHRPKGFTLAEVISALLIFGLVTAGVFAIFSYSTKGFQQAILLQGLDGESQATQDRLVEDFQASHLFSVEHIPRTTTLADGANVNRDGFSFCSMTDWRDPSNFHPNGLPRWDRHIVYYATQEDAGRLVRQVVEPGGILGGPIPYAQLDSNLSSIPSENKFLFNSSTLSKNVLSFRVEVDHARQLLSVNLQLRRQGGKTAAGSGKVDQTQELVFSIEALNTYPRL